MLLAIRIKLARNGAGQYQQPQKKDGIRRQGKDRRICFRGRICSIPCRASCFALVYLKEKLQFVLFFLIEKFILVQRVMYCTVHNVNYSLPFSTFRTFDILLLVVLFQHLIFYQIIKNSEHSTSVSTKNIINTFNNCSSKNTSRNFFVQFLLANLFPFKVGEGIC